MFIFPRQQFVCQKLGVHIPTAAEVIQFEAVWGSKTILRSGMSFVKPNSSFTANVKLR